MLTGRKLLLADDSVTIQKVISLTFGDEGMQVTTVSDGEQAVAKLEEVQPDIVLADIHMPKLDGYEVCQRIKQDERFRHLPVMLLVGSFEPFDEEEARRVGADDHLTKPFQSIKQLVNKVGNLLGTAPAQGEADTQELPTLIAAEEQSHHQEGADARLDDEALEVTTANTVPLPPPHREEFAQENEAVSQEQEQPAFAASESVDEETLETEPVLALDEEEAAPAAQPARHDEPAYAHAASGPQLGFAARQDDVLLDLGEIETAYPSMREDDLILDLQDESFYRRPPAEAATPQVGEMPAESEAALEMPLQLEEELAGAAPQAEQFTEAQLAGEERRADFAAVEAEDEQPLQQVSPAPVSPVQPQAGQIGLDQLSPEVIETIARRAVEQLSERVVREIAWEVVPELAELLIKRRLEEERTQTR